MVFKVGMCKEFDRDSWDFLEKLLLEFGFSSAFVHLIMGDLHSSYFFVLINGSPVGFFKAFRGIKLGDPLSACLLF